MIFNLHRRANHLIPGFGRFKHTFKASVEEFFSPKLLPVLSFSFLLVALSLAVTGDLQFLPFSFLYFFFLLFYSFVSFIYSLLIVLQFVQSIISEHFYSSLFHLPPSYAFLKICFIIPSSFLPHIYSSLHLYISRFIRLVSSSATLHAMHTAIATMTLIKRRNDVCAIVQYPNIS